jgi:hypothetical protein
MPFHSEEGDSRSIAAGSLRLAFRWTGHSWLHAVEHLDRDESIPRVLALSREGDVARDDPRRVVSPAYQQIHFQGEGPVVQALLVGQSGPHHVSAVFDFEEHARGEVTIRVDVADRCREPVDALASTYVVGARSDALVEADPARAAWSFGPGRLTFAAIPPARVALAEAGRLATSIQALAGPQPGAATRRYLYTWRWEPDPR